MGALSQLLQGRGAAGAAHPPGEKQGRKRARTDAAPNPGTADATPPGASTASGSHASGGAGGHVDGSQPMPARQAALGQPSAYTALMRTIAATGRPAPGAAVARKAEAAAEGGDGTEHPQAVGKGAKRAGAAARDPAAGAPPRSDDGDLQPGAVGGASSGTPPPPSAAAAPGEDVGAAPPRAAATPAATSAAVAAAAAGDGAAGGAAAPSAAATADVWHAHFSRVLTDAEVSTLLSGAGAAAAAYADADEGAAGCAWPRAVWQVAGRCGGGGGDGPLPEAHASLAAYGVKERLRTRWADVHAEGGQALADGDFVDARQRRLFSLLNAYMDVLLPAKPYPREAGGRGDESMDAVLLHALNHVAKSADLVRRTNQALAAAAEGGGVAGAGAEEVPRDQGFARPRVLLLLPMRNQALAVVRRLAALALRETRGDSVQGKERLVEQFTDPAKPDEDELSPEAAARVARIPPEHRALFAGNTDDAFVLGVKITRGAVRLFSEPLQSDVIVASPLALATALANAAQSSDDGGGGGGGGGKGRRGGRGGGGGGSAGPVSPADYLSSVEVVLVERCDVLSMQNWAHCVTVLDTLNRIPKQLHGADVMRVRPHLLSGNGRCYRQTIFTSSFPTPDINAAFARLAASHAGRARLAVDPPGVLSAVVPQVQQVFECFKCASAADASDARFAAFVSVVWPRLAQASGSGLLLFVPSYFDYVRLRNFFTAEGVEAAALCEYASSPDAMRARALFLQRRHRLLLYTERAHFYFRHRLRGVRDVYFYGLPDHAHFYAELINLIEDSHAAAAAGSTGGGAAAAAAHATVGALYCRWDALALGRVVGGARARKMLTRRAPTYVFC